MNTAFKLLIAATFATTLVGCANMPDTVKDANAAAVSEDHFATTDVVGKDVTYHVVNPDPIFNARPVLITKNGKGFLVDTQFSKADGDNLVALARAKGIDITTIYISFSDPDFYFGLDQVVKAFPKAKVLATPATIARIRASYPTKLEVWKDTLKENTPDSMVLPEALQGNTINFEGDVFEVVGSDTKRPTLFNAKDKVLLGGPLVNGPEHLFMADAKTLPNMQKWVDALEELKSFHPAFVLPAHSAEVKDFDPSNIQRNIDYIRAFMDVAKHAKTSEEIMKAMRAKFPNLADGSLEMSAQVVSGEMDWEPFDLP